MKLNEVTFGWTEFPVEARRWLCGIALVLLSGATYASPHTPAHEVSQTTKEWVFEETAQSMSNHRLVNNDERRMPSAVAVVCSDPVWVELAFPLTEYPGYQGLAYVDVTDRTENDYVAYFDAANSFGAFEQEDMFIRLRNLDDPAQHFTGSVCQVYWYYDLPLQEKQETRNDGPGCLSVRTWRCG